MVVGADLLGRLLLLVESWPIIVILRCVEDELGLCSLRSIDLRDLEWARVEHLFSRMGVDHWADVLVVFIGQPGLDDACHDVVHGVEDDFGLSEESMMDHVVDVTSRIFSECYKVEKCEFQKNSVAVL